MFNLKRDREALNKSRKGIEVWRSIPGYKGLYAVSNLGRVKSLARKVYHPIYGEQPIKAKYFKCAADKNGYPTVGLCKNGIPKRFYVHSLVLLAFCGKQPKNSHTRHLNGNPGYNYLHNIKYGTVIQNVRDRDLHGTSNAGSRNGKAKLKEEEVIKIKKILLKHGTLPNIIQRIADKFNVSRQTISCIKHGRRWSHVQV